MREPAAAKKIRSETEIPRPIPYIDADLVLQPETLEIKPSDSSPDQPIEMDIEVQPAGGSLIPRQICLAVTRDCNLECRYCYVRKRKTIRPGRMKAGMAVRCLDYIDWHRGTPNISFFGGEPLLNEEAITRVVNTVGSQASYHLTTNGTLIDRPMAEWLVDNDFSLIVSVDGPKEIHNFNRPQACKRDSYEDTLEGLHQLREAGAEHITLRSTYTSDCMHLRKRAKHLTGLIRDGLADNFSMECVSSTEAPCIKPEQSRLAVTEDDEETLRREMESVFDWVSDELQSGRNVPWHQLHYFGSVLKQRTPKQTECGAGYGYISFAPSGNIYACHREAGKPIGHVDIGIDPRNRCAWRENRWYGRNRCPSCWARNICGGGCRADSLVHEGDIEEPFGVFCMEVQMIIAHCCRLVSMGVLQGFSHC